MYPLLRFIKEIVKFRSSPRIGLFDAHVSTHMCWPWDLDPWIELNNGRTLTLYDLGRIPMAQRTGLVDLLRKKGWGFTVAGNSVRYRRRIRAFDRFTMVSRVLGWDEKFVYMEQSMWRKGECCNHQLIRAALTSKTGMVLPEEFTRVVGIDPVSPPLPEWVHGWIEAESARPWPPELPDHAIAEMADLP